MFIEKNRHYGSRRYNIALARAVPATLMKRQQALVMRDYLGRIRLYGYWPLTRRKHFDINAYAHQPMQGLLIMMNPSTSIKRALRSGSARAALIAMAAVSPPMVSANGYPTR